MTGQTARESAYAELVAGLVDARDDVATQRFDAELAAAAADGRVDPATARTLRWWQRASVRAVSDHTRNALPPVLAALDRAHDIAVEDVADAQRALDDAMMAAFPAVTPAADTEAIAAAAAPAPGGADGPTTAPEAPVDLTTPEVTSRRLLVAGLTPLPPS